MIKAFAYLRTSSASNVGTDKDSDKRQRAAIQAYAKAHGIQIVDEFYDAAVSGADAIESRPGFMALLERIDGNGVRTVLIEDASRFARTMMVQELGIALMNRRGVKVVTSSGDDLTETDDEMRVAMRQVFGAFSQMEKTRLVKKLKVARDRASEANGKRVEGRKGHRLHNPQLVQACMQARAELGSNATLQAIADHLNAKGLVNGAGKPLQAMTVKRLLEGAA